MKETFRDSGITSLEGKITQTKTITFVAENKPFATTVVTPPSLTTIPDTTGVPSKTGTLTPVSTSSPIAKKTTYTPLPEWVPLLGLVMAGVLILRRSR
jgi:hypothetical protein